MVVKDQKEYFPIDALPFTVSALLMVILLCGASILHLTGDLHKTLDSLDFAQELDEYINWYNCKRIKLSLCGLSPIEYRQRLGCAV